VAEQVISIIKLLPVGVAGGYGFSPEHAFGPPPHPPLQHCGRSALAGQQEPPQADWQALICGPAEGPAGAILALAASPPLLLADQGGPPKTSLAGQKIRADS